MNTTIERPPSTMFDCHQIQYGSRDEWLRGRMAGFGASDSAGLLGVGYSNQSPVTIVASKLQEQPDETTLPKRLIIGQLIEPALRTIFAHETDMPCSPLPDFTIMRHREIPYLLASLDAVTVHDELGVCVVELKNVSNFNRDDWSDDEPPLKFNVQCQHQMAVTGAKAAFLMGLVGGNEPVIKVIERNERFIDVLLKKLADFWGYVEREELPPVDESQATARLLAQFYSNETGETIALPHEADQWAADLEAASADAKSAEERKLFAQNKLKAAIGEASYGLTPSGIKFSWKSQTRKEYVVRESTTRVLRRCKA